ncbi:hypothetical protein G3N96_29305 [Burkholderia sp. Se-20373]|uniref:tail fiber domain-containing protein n=1 Tax=Burkholderia sp. Se-20373 TaxID=2703898 RepID=UPI00197D9206|nr:tail fiber domain-containing protein [Burkholderia sp. Se-20373]MBN3749491.1 hypothetical protein [Burkholderia sp. Se-20373]
MSILQKANLGVAPSGAGGDDQRTANMRFNANVDALAARLPLEYTYLSDNSDLQPSHVGTRFCLVMDKAGKVVKFPNAASVPQNACIHLFNLGQTVTIGVQPGDGASVSILNNGDWAEYVSDGGAYWHVVGRGRVSWNETVGGDLAVGGSVSVAGGVSAGGRIISSGEVQSANSTAFRCVNGQHGAMLRNDGSNVYFLQTKKGDVWGGWNDFRPFSWGLEDGAVRIDYGGAGCYIGSRPTWKGGLTPWDTGNLANPMTLDGEQKVSGVKRFTAPTYYSSMTNFGSRVTISASAPDGNWANAPLVISGYPGVGSIGIGSTDAAINIRCSATGGTLDVVSYTSAAFAPVAASAFNVNSDRAIKDEVKTIENAIEKLKRLRGVSYIMKSDETRARQLGVIAQEVAKEFPEAVTETSMLIDESGVTVSEGGRPMLAVNYSALIGPLLQAFIELEARVLALEG